jgi:acyl-CoA thioesterase-1
MRAIGLLALMALILLSGCDREQTDAAAMREDTGATAPPAPPEAKAAPATSGIPRVVFLGDSLTAGLGLEADEAFPARVGEMLRDEGIAVQVVNAGVSGDTTAGGLRRLDWLLRQLPDVVVVGLGGNDGLRATEVKSSEQNLREIVRKSRAAGAKVLLLGMLIPPNYGPQYTKQFREIYGRIAGEMNVPLVPFVLEGVGGEARLNQPDGIHPTAEGQRMIARNVLPYLRGLLDDTEAKPRVNADQRR